MSAEDEEMRNVKRAIGNFISNVNKSSNTKQLAVGSASGLVTGYITMKIGKTAAVAVGGGIILLQIAQNKGYIAIDWKKFKSNAAKTVQVIDNKYGDTAPTLYNKVLDFAKTNTCFAAGFLGGFLIGLNVVKMNVGVH